MSCNDAQNSVTWWHLPSSGASQSYITVLLGYRLEAVLRAVVVSSTGRLLVVPALIWGESYSAVGVALTHLFVASSNVQALRGGLKRQHNNNNNNEL